MFGQIPKKTTNVTILYFSSKMTLKSTGISSMSQYAKSAVSKHIFHVSLVFAKINHLSKIFCYKTMAYFYFVIVIKIRFCFKTKYGKKKSE